MTRSRALLSLAVILAAFAAPRPAAAYGSSCGTFTFTLQATTCFYQASGPGQYRAITLSGWRISVSHDGGPFQIVLKADQSTCAAPPGNAVSAGSIPAAEGDVVRLEIRQACFQQVTPLGTFPMTPFRFQAGFISGGDGAGAGVPSEPPTLTHLDPTNFCLAADTVIVTTGSMSCTYTAKSPTGEVIQVTPNHIDITYTDSAGSHTVYQQDSAQLPGRATFTQPVGAVMTVTVGPDSVPETPVAGAVGIVIAGDSV